MNSDFMMGCFRHMVLPDTQLLSIGIPQKITEKVLKHSGLRIDFGIF